MSHEQSKMTRTQQVILACVIGFAALMGIASFLTTEPDAKAPSTTSSPF